MAEEMDGAKFQTLQWVSVDLAKLKWYEYTMQKRKAPKGKATVIKANRRKGMATSWVWEELALAVRGSWSGASCGWVMAFMPLAPEKRVDLLTNFLLCRFMIAK